MVALKWRGSFLSQSVVPRPRREIAYGVSVVGVLKVGEEWEDSLKWGWGWLTFGGGAGGAGGAKMVGGFGPSS